MARDVRKLRLCVVHLRAATLRFRDLGILSAKRLPMTICSSNFSDLGFGDRAIVETPYNDCCCIILLRNPGIASHRPPVRYVMRRIACNIITANYNRTNNIIGEVNFEYVPP